MIRILILSLVLSLSQEVQASDGRIKELDWDGLKVTWLTDESLPVYQLTAYFADGSLSESPGQYGSTSAMFSMLGSGTRRFGQKEISDNLEFFGASFGPWVSHEYTTYSVSGLSKDVVPTMKMVCHLFKDATFPEEELKKEKLKGKSALQNIINSHGALAERAFREIALAGTPYSYPVSGKLKDIDKLTSKMLKEKLEYFNQKVEKHIFIAGPKSVLAIRPVLAEECGWKGRANGFKRTIPESAVKKRTTMDITLVTVPQANQAQVRFGKFLGREDIAVGPWPMDLASTFLGGGFTSRLMEELRVKRGLTYGVSALAYSQKEYGRAVISTSTKQESAAELVKITQEVLASVAKGEISPQEFERSRNFLAGSNPFRFERPSAYLSQIIELYHEGRP